jgi:hypothetical protein
MKPSAWIAVSLVALGFLGACGSNLPTVAPVTEAGGSVTAGVAGNVNGETFTLEQALITSQHRVLGLALFDRRTDPDMVDLAPGTWYLGVRFAYESPGPDLTASIVNYTRTASGSTACARLVHVDASGKRCDVAVSEGTLEITDWSEENGRIVRMVGSIDVRTADGGMIRGTFIAPVQGCYLAP